MSEDLTRASILIYANKQVRLAHVRCARAAFRADPPAAGART